MMAWTDPLSDSRSRLALLSQSVREWALFLDIDGTLLDIAEHPDLVQVPPALIGDLERVSASLDGALALVSGRAIAWIDRAFHPLRLPVAGQQGAEIRLEKHGPASTNVAVNLDGVRARLRTLDGVDGIEIEDKGLTIAVHYRRAHDRVAAAKAVIAKALATLEAGIEVVAGRLVYEVKARAANKGTAVARLLDTAAFSRHMPVYFGDDQTDEYGFREVLARGGIAVQVGPSQAPPGCLWIESPSETRRWLASLFGRVRESACA
ncbi:MAG TPA: trehalose-phosphatase [Stellaceae bacterium]|nr:trehalose-phosphatase [Stellaceae bacterium]